MNGVLNSLAIVAFGFGLLVLQSTLSMLLRLPTLAPNLLLPIVIYLGVSPDVHIVRGVIISFVLGYLLDLFCGNLMSLQTFVLVSTFMLARVAGLRLFLRGPAFQVLLTFVVGLLAGGSTLALRAIFDVQSPFPTGTAVGTALWLTGPAVVTALAAPLVFAPVQRLDAIGARRHEGAGASSP